MLGFVLGLLPGMVPAVTSFMAYDVEKRVSKYPERFGTGVIEGVAAPEAANNATAMAGFIPLLSLGVPTAPTLAIFLASLMIYGLQPGPLLFTQSPDVAWSVIASMYLANLILLVLNLPLVGVWARVATVPYVFLAPIVMSVCVVGAYCARNLMWDVWVCVAFGVVGYGLRRYGWPVAPLVLGLILGPKFEEALRQSLGMSGGDFSIFLSRPICVGFLVAGVVLFLLPLISSRVGPRLRRSATPQP